MNEKPLLDPRPPLGKTFLALTALTFALFLLLMFVSQRMCQLFFAASGIGYNIYFIRHGAFPWFGQWLYRKDHPILFWYESIGWFLAMAFFASVAFFGP